MASKPWASSSCAWEEEREKGRVKPAIQSLVRRNQSFPRNTSDAWHVSAHFSLAPLRCAEERIRLFINILGYLFNRMCQNVSHTYALYSPVSLVIN